MRSTSINEQQKELFFGEVFEFLKKKRNRLKVPLTREWAKSFPSEAGVYMFFEDGNLKYVGETGNIKGRMNDLLNTKHHTLRRSIGEGKYKNHKEYSKADSRNSYATSIENKLNKWFQEHLEVSIFPIHIGRKEFEEWIFEKHPNIIFYNKRKKRK